MGGRLRSIVCGWGAAVAVVSAACAGTAAAGEHYTFIQGINDQGWITGAFYDSAGGHGFIEKDGVYTNFDVPGSNYTYPMSINNSGEVAGFYEDAGGVRHGFTYKDGVVTTIDPAGSISTDVRGVNDSGALSGFYLGSDYKTRAYTEAGGVFTEFSHPLAYDNATLVSGINNAGDFTGWFYPADHGPAQSFVSIGGVLTNFVVPGAASTQAGDINDLGQVAGWYSTDFGTRFGFIWSAGVFTSLGFPGVYPQDTEAWGLNNLGDVVGTFYQDTDAHGFIYSKGVFTQIDHPGAFRPYPVVPEPSTWAMMILGFGAIGMAMRGRRRGLVKG